MLLLEKGEDGERSILPGLVFSGFILAVSAVFAVTRPQD
jgi:hypothetical protein